jgi:putative transposase
MPMHRKSTRLTTLSYLGTKAHFVTICCNNRIPHLKVPKTASRVIEILLESAAKESFELHAYCAMPNHLHFLAHGLSPRSNSLELVRLLKSRSAFEFKQERKQRLWESSFHDHILRKSDELEPIARYIWANPVRGGLCTSPEEHPFSGSQTISWIMKLKGVCSYVPPWKEKQPV